MSTLQLTVRANLKYLKVPQHWGLFVRNIILFSEQYILITQHAAFAWNFLSFPHKYLMFFWLPNASTQRDLAVTDIEGKEDGSRQHLRTQEHREVQLQVNLKLSSGKRQWMNKSKARSCQNPLTLQSRRMIRPNKWAKREPSILSLSINERWFNSTFDLCGSCRCRCGCWKQMQSLTIQGAQRQ